jgi:soluble lytic murein transglycosylase-like protein
MSYQPAIGNAPPASFGAHLSAVQGLIDRARQLGIPVIPPVVPRDGPGSASPPGPPGATPARFDDLVREAAAREGLDPSLVRAVVRAESNFDPQAVSPAGAKGLMQLTEATARSLGVTDVFDPAQNVAAGTRYLKQLLTRFGGDLRRALAAYNAGPGAVEQYGGVPPYAETEQYVRRVLGFLQTKDGR